MKQKITFFAAGALIGATGPGLAAEEVLLPNKLENASQPNPAEALCRKPRRVAGIITRPGQ